MSNLRKHLSYAVVDAIEGMSTEALIAAARRRWEPLANNQPYTVGIPGDLDNVALILALCDRLDAERLAQVPTTEG